MKKGHILIALSTGLLLLFQNCGQEYASTSLYGDSTNRSASDNCISDVVDCGPRVEFLQVSIDTPNPLALSSSLASYIVSGRCNVGNYPEHYIRFEAKNSTGSLKLFQNLTDACVLGRYEFPLVLSSLSANENHTLTVFIVGIDDQGNSYSNAQVGGTAIIDFYKAP